MKTTTKTTALLSFLLIFFLVPPVLGQQQIKNAKISFEFLDKGVKGSIAGFESKSTINWDNLEQSVLEGSVATETLDTNNGLRNWSLKSGKYFDKSDHPRIRYKSSQIQATASGYAVSGTLTIKGIAKPMTINFTREGNRLIGKATVFTSDFDIKIKKKREDNEVAVRFEFDLE